MQPSDDSEAQFSRLSQFDRVDQICAAFEQALLAGDQPDLEDYVGQANSEQERPRLRAELRVIQEDYLQRRRERGDTQDASRTDSATSRDERAPAWIGRYRVERLLGKGGFGAVYLAHDELLDRQVAIKTPYSSLISRPEDAELYLTEARAVARLDHPHIVAIHDVGGTENCPCFIVSKYVEGTDLASTIKDRRISHAEAAALVATVADALDYAHRVGLVHRDVKPGNILIGHDGKPYVVDFGVALRDEHLGSGPRYAGTLADMSPEQARGEGHRVDRRSDVFSLDVVFYELLAGRRPFLGTTPEGIVDQVTRCEPELLRKLNPTVPAELERICFKALAKRASERYLSARDLADDLRYFLARRASIETDGGPERTTCAGLSVQIVPRGLRSFDAHDSEFFPQLLPGPKDHAGLPASLRFWKTRIEETEPSATFSIGVIYGPSGCGKSSLVKAGLLPRLSSDIVSIYVEATADDLEPRLLNSLRLRCRAVRDQKCLRDALAELRQGHGLSVGKKLLIVVDQFEQWLHARPESEYGSLADALRQCDGVNVQCILMIRDDFWLAVSRFMRVLDERFIDGHNVALVDLFDTDHAAYVLALLGAAFGRVPHNLTDMTEAQKSFIGQAINGLAEDGKVICVRLALFAEMMKAKCWTPATLKQVGGTEGVGCKFLDETFGSAGASAEHRYHEGAARGILNALLPEPGVNLKGHMRTRAELSEASGYADGQPEFDDVMRILDDELRLITPIDPKQLVSADSTSSEASAAANDATPGTATNVQQYFQLTHDYLVPSLREWLARKQKESRSGRAELLLAERATLWSSRHLDRLLPSLREYISIQLLTDPKQQTESQRRFMRRAGRVHGRRVVGALIVLVVVVMVGTQIRQMFRVRQNASRAESLVDALLHAEISEVPVIVDRLGELRTFADPRLQREYASSPDGSPQRLRAALGLLPVDDQPLPSVIQRLTVCTSNEFPVLLAALMPHAGRASETLWEVARDEHLAATPRFQAAAALATLASDDPRWADLAPLTATHLTASIPTLQFGDGLTQLQPASKHLTKPLAAILADRSLAARQREGAAIALASYLKEAPDPLVDAMLLTDEHVPFVPFLEALRSHAGDAGDAGQAVRRLQSEIARAMPGNPSEESRDAHWRKQSLAAVALLQLGHGHDVWPLLELTPNPSLRSYIVFQLGHLRCEPGTLADQLAVEQSVPVRRALLQALGGTNPSLVLPADHTRIAEQIKSLYLNDPDAGIHGAASWTLRQWGIALPDAPRDGKATRSRDPRWYVNGQGQTFVVLPNPKQLEPGQLEPGQLEPGQLDHDFAIASHEVTVSEFQRFMEDHVVYREMVPTDQCPVHRVTWYMAAAYCNWLSAQEDIPEDQWIYLPNDAGEFANGMRIKEGYLELTGYRLPTEAEWEYACRAGTSTSYHFGEPLALLERYAMYVLNASGHSHPVESLLPNDFGLFDMHGNAWEWAHDVAPDTLTPVLDSDSRILRGGSFSANPSLVLSNYRLDNKPDFQHIRFGFRVARRMRLSTE